MERRQSGLSSIWSACLEVNERGCFYVYAGKRLTTPFLSRDICSTDAADKVFSCLPYDFYLCFGGCVPESQVTNRSREQRDGQRANARHATMENQVTASNWRAICRSLKLKEEIKIITPIVDAQISFKKTVDLSRTCYY